MRSCFAALALTCASSLAGGVNNPPASAAPSGACGGDLGGSYPNCTVTGQHFSAKTGTGNVVLQTSPTLTTPVLGAASATTVNKVTLTAPATGSTLTIADGKTLTVSNTLTLTGTDGSSLAIGTGGTLAAVATNGSAASLTGTLPIGSLPSTYTNCTLLTATSGNWTVPANATSALIFRQAAGGGGGGTAGTLAASAQGGTSGAFDMHLFVVTPSASIAYTIGAKGTGGAAGNNNGNNGGDLTFGAMATLKGGVGGNGSGTGTAAGITSTALQAVRPTSTLTTGDIMFPGASINNVAIGAATTVGGTGGFCLYGTPGSGGTATANGTNATGYGCAGGGGADLSSGVATSGGDGAPGAIMACTN